MTYALTQGSTTLRSIIQARRSIRVYDDQPVARAALERIVAAAQGDTPDDRRNVPSAHGVYPLTTFVLTRRIDDARVAQGLHAVDRHSGRIGRVVTQVERGALLDTSLADDVWLENAAAVIVVAADYATVRSHFADHQADGRRGDRYAHIEAGALLQNMHLATSAECLGGVIVAGFDDARLAQVLDLPDGLQTVSLFCVGVPAD